METKELVSLSQQSTLMSRTMRLPEFVHLPSNHVWEKLSRVTVKQMRYISSLLDFPTTPEKRAKGVEILRRVLGNPPIK